MKFKGIAATGIAALAVPAVALAASGPTIKASVSPNTPKAKSTLKLSAKGPFNQTGLPTTLQLNLQKGFSTSAKSVTQLCDTSSVPPTGSTGCPAASQIGSGTAQLSFMGSSFPVALALYLGNKQQSGDIASVILSETFPGPNEANTVGRLFKTSTGQIELLFESLPPGPFTLNSIKFSAHAVNGKNSLVKNPSTCPKSHHWSGRFTLGFTSGTVSKKLKIACKA